jgi:predicted transcriptional regulator
LGKKTRQATMDNEATPALVNPAYVATIVKNYVAHNSVAAADIPNLIAAVHSGLLQVGTTPEAAEPARSPAVSIRRSVSRDAVICLECGRKGKTLRRHIRVMHGLDPDEYRARWGLKPDHPLVAPGYSELRSTTAKDLGLGRGRNRTTAEIPPTTPQSTKEPRAPQEAHAGLDPAFQASLSQPKRRRSRRSAQETAGG